MEKDITRLAGMASVFIIGEAILAPALLFHASAAGIAFSVYIGLGLGLFVFIAVHERLRRDEPRQMLEQALVERQAPPNSLAHFRRWLYSSALILMGVTCWPAMQFGLHSFRIAPSMERTNSVMGLSAGLTLFPVETSIAVFVAAAPQW